MKRLLAFSFILIFLQANTAFGELLKIPMLVHHYVAHADETRDHNFISFLVEHYIDNVGHSHQSHQSEHEKLPFKTLENHFSFHFSIDAPIEFLFSKPICTLFQIKTLSIYLIAYTNTYLDRIWQPPKIA